MRSLLLLAIVACTGGPSAVNGGADKIDVHANTSNLPSPLPNATDIATIGSGPQVLVGVLAYQDMGQVRQKLWQLEIRLASLPMAGDSYTLGSPSDPLLTPQSGSLMLEDFPSVGGVNAWGSTGGTLTIGSRSGTRARLLWSAVPMAVTPDGTGNTATGTFELDADITVDDIEHSTSF